MQSYIINLNQVEELQMIKGSDELERIFNKAKSAIVQGEKVVIMRTDPGGAANKVDELSTEPELEKYKDEVMKYM